MSKNANVTVKCKLFNELARVPVRGTSGSAGYDLKTCYDYSIKPGDCVKVDTGVGIQFPSGLHGRIIDRSSVAYTKKLHVIGSLVDGDYTGRIFVILANFGTSESSIKAGERVAQLVFERYATVDKFVVVESLQCQSGDRGEHGFGSTTTADRY